MAGSFVCALAPSMLVLIFGRVLHGLGGGGLSSVGMIVLADLVSPKERGRYYGYFAATYTTAGGCGPLLGGLIADHLHWSVIFWINIPMGLAALAITTSLLRRLPRHERPHLLDIVGAALIVMASVSFMLALNLAGVRYPWSSPPILALFVASELSTLFWARYLLFTLPGFVLLAALTLDRYGVPIAAGGLLVLALLAGPGQTAIRTPDGHNHATTAAAGVIAANEQPGDGIAYALNEPVVPWEARDIVARYVPAGKRPRDVFALTPQRVDGHLTATECADLPGCLDDMARLWVGAIEN